MPAVETLCNGCIEPLDGTLWLRLSPDFVAHSEGSWHDHPRVQVAAEAVPAEEVAAAGQHAATAWDNYRAWLGPPAGTRVDVLLTPRPIAGRTRGTAAPGIVWIAPTETGGDCDTFAGSGGRDSGCLAWTVSHEIAHLWFAWTAVEPRFNGLGVTEGIADYLAMRLLDSDAGSTFKRMQCERVAATPVAWRDRALPRTSVDDMGVTALRSLVYARPALAWAALEDQAGWPAVRAVLRELVEDQALLTHAELLRRLERAGIPTQPMEDALTRPLNDHEPPPCSQPTNS